MKHRQRINGRNHSGNSFLGVHIFTAIAVIFLFGSAIGGFAEAGMIGRRDALKIFKLIGRRDALKIFKLTRF